MFKKIMILCLSMIMIANVSFSQNLKKIAKKSPYKSGSYYSIAQDVLKGKVKPKSILSKSEKNALNRFVQGKRQSSKNIKYFVSAIGKHKCFSLKKTKKTASLKAWPQKKAVGNWYTLDCKARPDKVRPTKKIKPANKKQSIK